MASPECYISPSLEHGMVMTRRLVMSYFWLFSFYVKMKISVDFHICISAPLTERLDHNEVLQENTITTKLMKIDVSEESSLLWKILVNFGFGDNKHLKGLLTTNDPKARNSFKNAWALLVSLVEKLPGRSPAKSSILQASFFPFSFSDLCCRAKSL